MDTEHVVQTWAKRALIDSIPGGVIEFRSSDGAVIFASDGFYCLTGYEREDFEQLFSADPIGFIHPDDRALVQGQLKGLLSDDTRIELRYRICKKSGTVSWVRVCGHLIPGSDRCLCVILDETAQVLAYQQMERAKTESDALINSIPGGVLRLAVGENIRITFASDGFYKMLGYEKEAFEQEISGEDVITIIFPEDRESFRRTVLEQFREKREASSFEYRVLHKNGEIRWHLFNGVRMPRPHGESILQCVVIDITNMKKTKAELDINLERYRILLEHADGAIFDWDLVNDRIYISAAFEAKFGYALPEEMFSHTLLHSGLVFAEDLTVVNSAVKQANCGKLTKGELECRIKKKDGIYIWCKSSFTVLFDENRKAIKTFGILTDIDRYKRENEKLGAKAHQDLLTGLFNKVTTEELVKESLLQNINQKHALFILDVDNFKEINDTMGHLPGDEALVEIAQHIRKQFRSEDIVGRIGGDEFAIFLKNIKSQEIIERKAELLVEVFSKSLTAAKTGGRVSISIGVSVYPHDGKTYEELFKKADVALYYSKQQGKNCYHLYSKQVDKLYDRYSRSMRLDRIDSEKSVSGNFERYVFQTLCETPDTERAINMILDMTARIYRFEHIYIYEDLHNPEGALKTFEWCARANMAYPERGVPFQQETGEHYLALCDSNGIFYSRDTSLLPEPFSSVLQKVEARSVLHIPMKDGTHIKGLIGFSATHSDRVWNQKIIDSAVLISQIISMHLMRNRSHQQLQTAKQTDERVLDQIHAGCYVVNSQYHIVYINRQLRNLGLEIRTGERCYRVFRDREEPCEDCPIRYLSQKKDDRYTQKLFMERFGMWEEVTASRIDWMQGQQAYLLTCYDVSHYVMDQDDRS